MLELYKNLTSAKGRDIVANGWKAAGITNAITLGSSLLENLGPFAELDPLDTSVDLSASNPYNASSVASKAELGCFITPKEVLLDDSDEDEWNLGNEDDRNIFGIIDDESM